MISYEIGPWEVGEKIEQTYIHTESCGFIYRSISWLCFGGAMFAFWFILMYSSVFFFHFLWHLIG